MGVLRRVRENVVKSGHVVGLGSSLVLNPSRESKPIGYVDNSGRLQEREAPSRGAGSLQFGAFGAGGTGSPSCHRTGRARTSARSEPPQSHRPSQRVLPRGWRPPEPASHRRASHVCGARPYCSWFASTCSKSSLVSGRWANAEARARVSMSVAPSLIAGPRAIGLVFFFAFEVYYINPRYRTA